MSNIYSRIAEGSPDKALQLLKENGAVRKPENTSELTEALIEFVKQGGDIAKVKLADIHPDRTAILSTVSFNGQNLCADYDFSNCSGCPMASFSADAKKTTAVPLEKNYTTLIIAGSTILLAMIITTMIVSNK